MQMKRTRMRLNSFGHSGCRGLAAVAFVLGYERLGLSPLLGVAVIVAVAAVPIIIARQC